MQKIRVGVLMGGRSIEREVSFNSGRTVCDHLDTTRYDVIPLYQTVDNKLYILSWQFLYRGKTSDFEHRLDECQIIKWDDLKNTIDFAYIALHGRYAEDGTLQGLLEILNIPYLGSDHFTSALCMNKKQTNAELAHHTIITPRGYTISKNSCDEKEIYELHEQHEINFPCIVKPNNEGSSLGVSVVHTLEKLIPAITHARTAHPDFEQDVLIEEKISGLEFSCIIFINSEGICTALPVTEVVHANGTDFFDYEQKYMPGSAIEFTPARCDVVLQQKIQNTCIQVVQALNMRTMARIDGFLQNDGTVVIVDVNTLSGMAPASFLFREAAHIGMNHTAVINHLIETELKTYNMLSEKNNSATLDSSAPQLRIGVLMGGASHEREISLESGRNVCYKLSPAKYHAIPIFVTRENHLYIINEQLLVRNSTDDIHNLLKPHMRIGWHDLAQHIDFAFIALHGGHGENGCVQGALEMMNIPYNGSGVYTSALCLDKYKTGQTLAHHNIVVPTQSLITIRSWQKNNTPEITRIEKSHNYPVIIKPHDDGCSVMVAKATNRDELIVAIDAIARDGKKYALVEEFISGMELTVGIIGNDTAYALPASWTVKGDAVLSIQEKFLPGAGENQTPAPLSASAQELVSRTCEEVYRILGCAGYVRIDCFYQNAQISPTGTERVIIIEVNSLPGLTPATCLFHQAAEIGIKPMDLIDTIIQLGLSHHNVNAGMHNDAFATFIQRCNQLSGLKNSIFAD